MPKIRQALALLIAAGCCIGFNTYRYPVVREMAAAISPLGRSEAASPGETPAAAAEGAGSGSAEEPALSAPAGVVCKDGVCTIASPDSPADGTPFSPPGDSSTDASKETAEGAASSAKEESEAESTLKPYGDFPSEPQTDGATSSRSWPGESPASNSISSGESESDSEGSDNPSSPKPFSAPQKSRMTTAAKHPPEASGETKTAAKLVSSLVGGKSPAKASGTSPATKQPLIPIQRPKSRRKETLASASHSVFDAKPEAGQEPPVTPPRRLPPVDQVAIADSADPAPPLSPDLVRTYPVTP